MRFLPADLVNFASNYFYLFIIAAIFQGALVLILGVLFLDKFLSSKPKRVQDEIIRQEAYKRANELLESTTKQAHETVQSAHAKAEVILKDTVLFTQGLQKSLEVTTDTLFTSYKTEIAKLSADILTTYNKSLAEDKITTLASYTASTEDIKKQALTELQKTSQDVRQIMSDTQELLKNDLEGDLKDLRTRLKSYEDLRMRKVDERIFDILTVVSKEALGKIMSLSDHQDLVLKTLADAKAQNLF